MVNIKKTHICIENRKKMFLFYKNLVLINCLKFPEKKLLKCWLGKKLLTAAWHSVYWYTVRPDVEQKKVNLFVFVSDRRRLWHSKYESKTFAKKHWLGFSRTGVIRLFDQRKHRPRHSRQRRTVRRDCRSRKKGECAQLHYESTTSTYIHIFITRFTVYGRLWNDTFVDITNVLGLWYNSWWQRHAALRGTKAASRNSQSVDKKP